jgi:hypothetical protein
MKSAIFSLLESAGMLFSSSGDQKLRTDAAASAAQCQADESDLHRGQPVKSQNNSTKRRHPRFA